MKAKASGTTNRPQNNTNEKAKKPVSTQAKLNLSPGMEPEIGKEQYALQTLRPIDILVHND
jgi:hypothetical protein